MEIELQEIDELKNLANYIRKNESDKLCIFVDKQTRIVIERELETCETIFSIMNIMDEFKNIQLNYMPDFSCIFEMWMFRNKPTIYCTYERNKTK
jgi:hypothetical protein